MPPAMPLVPAPPGGVVVRRHHAVVQRVVGVDLPVEEVGVEGPDRIGVLGHDLEVDDGPSHGVLLRSRVLSCAPAYPVRSRIAGELIASAVERLRARLGCISYLRTMLHHLTLWVPDLGRAKRSWSWLLGGLGYHLDLDRAAEGGPRVPSRRRLHHRPRAVARHGAGHALQPLPARPQPPGLPGRAIS